MFILGVGMYPQSALRRSVATAATAVLATILAACSGGSDESSTPASTSAPATSASASASASSAKITAAQREQLSGHPVELAAADAKGPKLDTVKYPSDVEVLLGSVLELEDPMWTTFMEASKLTEQQFGVTTVASEAGSSSCLMQPVNASYRSTFFCPTDTDSTNPIHGVHWFPAATLLKLAPKGKPTAVSAFPLAAVLADTWNAGMVAEMARQLKVAVPADTNAVLLPECFTGVWAAHAYGAGTLSAADEKAAVAAMTSSVSYGFDPVPPPVPAADRLKAFQLGAHGGGSAKAGDPGACATAYWPAA